MSRSIEREENEVAEAQEQTPEQQSLLPEFEGRSSAGATLAFNGTTELDERSEASGYGEQVYYLLIGEVVGVGHARRKKVGMVRSHTVEVGSAYKLDELHAKTVIKELTDGQRALQVSHRHRNDDPGDEGTKGAEE